MRQAREACYALRDFIEKDPLWTQGRLRWDHVVVLPNTDLPEGPAGYTVGGATAAAKGAAPASTAGK